MTEQGVGQVAGPTGRPAETSGDLLLSWGVRPGGGVLVEAGGVLDAASSARFAELVREQMAASSRGLVLDLSRLTFLDTHGVVVLTEAAHRARVRGVELVLVSGNRVVDRVLSLLELDGWFRRSETATALDQPDGGVPRPRQPARPEVHRES
jgi:anti-anti-sigma factor